MGCVRYGLSVVVHIFPEIPDDGVNLFLGKDFEGGLSDSGLRHKLLNIAWCRGAGFLEAASDCVLCGWTYHGCRSSPSTRLRGLECAMARSHQPDPDWANMQICLICAKGWGSHREKRRLKAKRRPPREVQKGRV